VLVTTRTCCRSHKRHDRKVADLQEQADDAYSEAQDLYSVYGLDCKRAQELELTFSRLNDKASKLINDDPECAK
jgi:hypothetical protein